MNIIFLIKELTNKLLPYYQENAINYSWWLIEELTDNTKTELINKKELLLNQAQKQKLDTWLNELISKHKPLAYVVGHIPFAGCDILLEPPILIPRPETEQWCLELITQLKEAKINSFTMLDMCTGSGCIALAFAKAFSSALVYAVDINPKALFCAKKNALYNNILNIHFLESDLFSSIDQNFKVDFIVSNPPYISADAFSALEPTVKQWEDYDALVSNDNGLEIIKKIIPQAYNYISPNFSKIYPKLPSLLLEIGFDQGMEVKKNLEFTGYVNVIIGKDYQGHDRTVQGNISNAILEKKL